MGLLDDAIRQHLELKRRRGADPDEVARQEDDALGPVTGAAAPAVADEPVVEVPFEHAEPEPLDDPPVPYESPAPQAPPEPAPEPPPAAEDPAEDPAFDLDSPTVEFSPEDEEPADELSETPEFLQETPEHDRLWFEQKPPRDFDF